MQIKHIKKVITRARNKLEKIHSPSVATKLLMRKVESGEWPQEYLQYIKKTAATIKRESRERAKLKQATASFSPLQKRHLTVALARGRTLGQFLYTERQRKAGSITRANKTWGK